MPNKINPQKRSADLISSDVSSVASEEALDTGPDQDRARDASKRELIKRKFFCRIVNRVGIPLHDYFSCHPELAKVLDFRDQLPEKQKKIRLSGPCSDHDLSPLGNAYSVKIRKHKNGITIDEYFRRNPELAKCLELRAQLHGKPKNIWLDVPRSDHDLLPVGKTDLQRLHKIYGNADLSWREAVPRSELSPVKGNLAGSNDLAGLRLWQRARFNRRFVILLRPNKASNPLLHDEIADSTHSRTSPEKIYFNLPRNLTGYAEHSRLLKLNKLLPVEAVENPVPHVGCYERTAVQVPVTNKERTEKQFIHANTIRFYMRAMNDESKINDPKSTRAAIAGQSPRSNEACERLLLQGLDSGQGLFQFVTPNVPDAGTQNQGWPIINWLSERWSESKNTANRPLILGGRYYVSGVENLHAGDGDHQRCKLRVRSVNDPSIEKEVVITQANLALYKGVLDFKDLLRADEMMNAHRGFHASSNGISGDQFCTDPMVLSCQGVGRNAALICFREAALRLGEIKKVEEIDQLVSMIFQEGRRDRGPYFLSTKGQINEIKIALIDRFNQVNAIDTTGLGGDPFPTVEAGMAAIREEAVKPPKKRVRFADDDPKLV